MRSFFAICPFVAVNFFFFLEKCFTIICANTEQPQVSNSCSWVKVAAPDANRCHGGMMVLDAAEASPWQRFASRTLACAKEAPGSTRSPPQCRGSPGVPGHHIVSAMINYRPDEMWRLWKCHRDDMGLSVWASREEGIAHRHLEGYGAPAAHWRELLITWAGFCWILCNFIFTYSILPLHCQCAPWVWISALMSFVISIPIKWNANPIKVEPIYHAVSEKCVFSPNSTINMIAHGEWAVNTWLY